MIHNEKKYGNKVSFLQDAKFTETKCLGAGLVDPCVFPVCSAFKVVHYSEYIRISEAFHQHILIF